MKKTLPSVPVCFVLCLLLMPVLLAGQGKLRKVAKPGLKLVYKESKGKNATAVTWNPKLKYYFSVKAGNKDYPIATFNASGKLLFQDEAGFDFRSLWWNPKTSQLEGDGYKAMGWRVVNLKSGKIATASGKRLRRGFLKPHSQAVGAYDLKKKWVVYYWPDSLLVCLSRKKAKVKKQIPLKLEAGIHNVTTVVYVGHKKWVYGLLDVHSNGLRLFDRKGRESGYIKLPPGTILANMFRFSFANQRLWLFDPEQNAWQSYSIFED